MPRITTNSLIQKAIYPATQDRLAMLDADPAHAEGIRIEIAEIESLRGLRFDRMTDKQCHTAMMALTYAEQWESSLADSLGAKDKDGREALQLSNLFRTHRHMTWGKNRLEEEMDAGEDYFLDTDKEWRTKDGKVLQFRDWPGSSE
jgi:hypothetical protein